MLYGIGVEVRVGPYNISILKPVNCNSAKGNDYWRLQKVLTISIMKRCYGSRDKRIIALGLRMKSAEL